MQREVRISNRSFANMGRLLILILHAFAIWVRSFFPVPRRSPASGPLRGLHGRRGRRRRTSPRPPWSTRRRTAGAPRPPAQRVTGAAVLRRPRGPPGAPTPATAVRRTTKFGSRQQGKAARGWTGLQYNTLLTLRCYTLFVLHYEVAD